MNFLFSSDSDSDTECNYGADIDLVKSVERLATKLSTVRLRGLPARRRPQARPHSFLLGRTQPSGHLPQVCYRHNSRAGCMEPDCRRLHLCSRFLADICNFGTACRKGHSLTTAHNQMVCERHGLDTSRELACVQQLRHGVQENTQIPNGVYHRNLQRCFKFGSANPCDQHFCNRLHICRDFIAGNCTRRGCRFGHDLHTTHNNSVLSRHKVSTMSDTDIMALLKQKYPGSAEQGTTGTASATAGPRGGGAIPRRPTRGGPQGRPSREAGRAVQPDPGLAEELQCPVCLDMFRRPITLNCGHTLCQGCLDDVRELGGDTRCPMCREPITSTSRSVTLENIIRSQQALKVQGADE